MAKREKISQTELNQMAVRGQVKLMRRFVSAPVVDLPEPEPEPSVVLVDDKVAAARISTMQAAHESELLKVVESSQPAPEQPKPKAKVGKWISTFHRTGRGLVDRIISMRDGQSIAHKVHRNGGLIDTIVSSDGDTTLRHEVVRINGVMDKIITTGD